MGLTIRQSSMKVFVTLCALVAAASSAPRYVILPIEDVDLSVFNGQYLPVVRVPGLARQARQVLEEDEFTNTQGLDFRPRQSQRREGDDSQTSASEPGYGASDAAPAGHAGPDHVDYGAYTGGYGAFGWYTDHPVLLGPGGHGY